MRYLKKYLTETFAPSKPANIVNSISNYYFNWKISIHFVDPTYVPPVGFHFKNAKLEDKVVIPAEVSQFLFRLFTRMHLL